ncbi:mitotic checkpoint protein-domain-containing protein [Jimgerdemannia flammicorona]|uniref:Spindle assembly checkpoint component MAD1 n=1 Tax=Jimgerdemannia flammicorona TaxID=994334 RepID=A0A433QQ54_9FUNG|nr:mitotic checkpoint protein-domain-containing protein [Jimgerdemannia flammicorona]
MLSSSSFPPSPPLSTMQPSRKKLLSGQQPQNNQQRSSFRESIANPFLLTDPTLTSTPTPIFSAGLTSSPSSRGPPFLHDVRSELDQYVSQPFSASVSSSKSQLALSLRDLENTPGPSCTSRLDFRPSFSTSSQIPRLTNNQNQYAADAELARARKQISDLKFELATVKTDAERKDTAWDKTRTEMEIQAKEMIVKVERLESNIQYLYEREKEASQKLEEVEKENVRIKVLIFNYTVWLDGIPSQGPFNQCQREPWCTFFIIRLFIVRFITFERDLARKRPPCASTSRGEPPNQGRARRDIGDEPVQRKRGRTEDYESADASAGSRGSFQAGEGSATTTIRLSETQRKLDEAEENLRELRAQEADRENMGVISRQFHDQVTHVRSLEKENRSLSQELKHYKELYQNIEILREQKSALQSELSRMDQLRERLGELEVENALLKKEKVQWASFLDKRDNTGIDSPYFLAKTLAAQRYEIAGLLENQGTLTAEIKSRDTYITKVEGYMQELKEKYTSLDERYQKDLRNMRRLEKSKLLAQKEIGFLREQLKTYDTEETTFMQGNYDVQKAKRIEQLEELLEEYKLQLKQAEERTAAAEVAGAKSASPVNGDKQTSEMMAASASGKALHSHISEVTKQKEELLETVNNLRKENAILQKEMSSLDHQVGVLEEALARGEYNPQTTRVLELRDNLASREQTIRESTLEGLRAENKVLLEKLQQSQSRRGRDVGDYEPLAKKRKAMEDPEDAASEEADTVPRQSLVNLRKENERLEAQVAEKEKRMMRLKEIWKAKGKEFLEAVHSLLGYKFDFLENGRVRLTSMYSEANDHSFLFTSNDNNSGTLQLVGGGNDEYMKSLQNQIKFWVNERGSIPAFLSNVTMELFDRTTMMGRGTGWEGAERGSITGGE